MKLYDFHCTACGADFEDLVRELADARCPKCASAKVDKQLSRFSVGGGHAGTSTNDWAPSCGGGTCGTGSCGFGS